MTIRATIIADSITERGDRMTTMEIEYPRFILAELNTHRMLSKNSASSRAIPIKSMHESIWNNPATPVYWGKNQPGMKAKEEVEYKEKAKTVWQNAMYSAIGYSNELDTLGIHKQIANRITEPWMTMKTVISGTEWGNFYHLRDHPDAQPEIRELAMAMRKAHNNSYPRLVNIGEWHVPYILTFRDDGGKLVYSDGSNRLNIEEALIISASCCAQVSYRKSDTSLEKAHKIYDQLINSTPAHASPVEHQAAPMQLSTMCAYEPETWERGVTHVSANGDLWSGNLRNWVQYRKLIHNEANWDNISPTYVLPN